MEGGVGGTKLQLEEAKLDLCKALDTVQEDNREYFRKVAHRAWVSYRTPDDDAVVKTPDGKIIAGYDAFEARIVDAALAKMPGEVEIMAGIYADYRTGFLITPPEAMQAQVEMAQAHAAIDKAHAEASAAEAKARMAWQEEREKDMALAEKQMSQQAKLAAIKQVELEHARQQLQQITSPLQEVMDKFRAQMYADVVSIAESIKKNGHLRGKVAQKARGLKDLYDLLASATGDDELEIALQSLQNSLDVSSPDGSKYNITAVEQALESVSEVTRQAAEDVARRTEMSSRAGFLEF